ncbi:uncharacterized protein FRV6_11790 [Fusarium oxysporum]|uniref:Uncharacterized protein n=1 Tax=Fusarium oxysporum TaxID=5507 RepID=A0A2H3TG38_FUSOX|nr:uncharacterized protein FRV6_11790 [Fusarium oxysporum]
MANACAHQLHMIKSDNTLVQWNCQHCYSGPHWMIWECMYCKLHLCQPCTSKDPNPSVDFALGGSYVCISSIREKYLKTLWKNSNSQRRSSGTNIWGYVSLRLAGKNFVSMSPLGSV